MELDPRADRLRETIDRSTLELYGASVVISFGLVGRRSFTEFVSRTGWIASLSPEFEVAGSSFAGRSFNVGGFSPRRASISVRSRDRDVSCVDFVSIIHPDYRPEPIRERTLIKLARSRRRRRDDKRGSAGFGERSPPVTRAYFWNGPIHHRVPEFRLNVISETCLRLYRSSITDFRYR